MNQTMSDDIPQDQVEAVYHAIASGLSFDAPTTKIAEGVIRVLTPLIAAVERERCATLAESFRVSDSRAPHKYIRDGIARAIRSVKGAVT